MSLVRVFVPVVVGLAACAASVPRASYTYRVTRVREALASCDPSLGAERATVDPPYLVVRDDVVTYRVVGCSSEADCALVRSGAARDAGSESLRAPVPSFAFTAREVSGSGSCEGVTTTWRSGPVGAPTLQVDRLERTLTGVPRETSGACSLDVAESRAASTPCDKAIRYEGALVAGP